jgi:hypothetical protein
MASHVTPAAETVRLQLSSVGDPDEDVVRAILCAARYRPTDGRDGPISTSRLFLGVIDAWRTSDPLSGDDPFSALRRAIRQLPGGERAVMDLNRAFHRMPLEDATERLGMGLSDNSTLMLVTVARADRKRLTGHGLVTALLQPSSGLLWERLERSGVDFVALRSLYDEELATAPTVPLGRTLPAAPLSVPSFTSDNPWADRLTDSIGVEAEAAAFARLVLHTDVRPPLAVGVFGDWGTGKTYFMRKVFETIKAITASVAGAGSAGSEFHADVVQIRFNAWHYVETNLWASIVDHIFTELDRWIAAKTAPEDANSLLSRLATARTLTIDAAQSLVERRRERRDAEDKLRTAESELADARTRSVVQPSDVVESFRQVFSEEIDALKDDATHKALEQTGLSELQSSAQAFRAKLNSLTDEGRHGSVMLEQLVRLLGSGWSLAFLIAAIIVAPTILVAGKQLLLALPFGSWMQQVPDLVVAASGLLAGLTVAGGRMLGAISPVLDRLTSFRIQLDAKLEAKLAAQAAARDAAAAEASAKAAEVERARGDLETARQALASAMGEYAAETGFRRLQRFIQGRAKDGTYARHLGLVATIRRDFEQLSNLMLGEPLDPQVLKAREAYERDVLALIASAGDLLEPEEASELRESAEPVTDHKAAKDVRLGRIILYIDDLDRCPPSKVVDVLQAVHMLLTFQLFVVFVAVDARWVTRALLTHYPDLLVSDPKSATSGTPAANAHDYLEKIFQIPYWVRPLTSDASRKYLNDLLGPSTAHESERPADLPPQSAATAQHDDGPPRLQLGPTTPKPYTPTADGQDDTARDGPDFGDTEILKLSANELAFMETLAPYAGSSPRRLLRFVNVYRVITAAMDAGVRRDLRNDGSYLSLLTQLAIVTGASDVLHDWLAITDDDMRNNNCKSVAELLNWLGTDQRFGNGSPAGPKGWLSVRGAVQEYSKATGSTTDSLGTLRARWPSVARRYSFMG